MEVQASKINLQLQVDQWDYLSFGMQQPIQSKLIVNYCM